MGEAAAGEDQRSAQERPRSGSEGRHRGLQQGTRHQILNFILIFGPPSLKESLRNHDR